MGNVGGLVPKSTLLKNRNGGIVPVRLIDFTSCGPQVQRCQMTTRQMLGQITRGYLELLFLDSHTAFDMLNLFQWGGSTRRGHPNKCNILKNSSHASGSESHSSTLQRRRQDPGLSFAFPRARRCLSEAVREPENRKVGLRAGLRQRVGSRYL